MAERAPEGKLVRDRIPDIIRSSGGAPTVQVLSGTEYEAALWGKLEEEIAELRGATGEHMGEELADVLEVLKAIAAARGFDWSEVERVAAVKKDQRGGFGGRLWLEQS